MGLANLARFAKCHPDITSCHSVNYCSHLARPLKKWFKVYTVPNCSSLINNYRQIASMKKLDQILDEIQIRTRDDIECISTGYPSLDSLLGGGWQKEGLTVLSGYPGMGCSTLALNSALNISIEKRTIILARKNCIDDFIKRIITVKTGIEFHKITEVDKCSVKEELKNLKLYFNSFYSMDIKCLIESLEEHLNNGIQVFYIDKFNESGNQVETLAALQEFADRNRIAIIYLKHHSLQFGGFDDPKEYELAVSRSDGHWIPRNWVYLFRPNYFNFQEMEDRNGEIMDASNVAKLILVRSNFNFHYDVVLLKSNLRYFRFEECNFEKQKFPNWFPASYNPILYNRDQRDEK